MQAMPMFSARTILMRRAGSEEGMVGARAGVNCQTRAHSRCNMRRSRQMSIQCVRT